MHTKNRRNEATGMNANEPTRVKKKKAAHTEFQTK